MPEAPSADVTEAARRFAADLRALRETRGVPLEAVQAETRVPIGVLQAFESTALAGHALFNKVYVRSLARAYADVVGLTPNLVVHALEEVFDGRYGGDLGRPGTAPPAPERLATPPRPPATAEVGDEDLTATDGYPAFAPVADLPPVGAYATDTAPAREAPPTRETPPPTAPDEPPPPRAPGNSPPPTAPPGSAPPATFAPAAPSRGATGTTAYEPVSERAARPAWGVPAAVLALVALGAGAWWFTRDTADAPAASPSGVAATAPGDRADTASTPEPAAPVALPDTLALVISADGAPVRGLRVRLDDEPRRPYWLEAGTERRLAFRDSAYVYGPPPAARLAVEGRPVPGAARRADGVVVLRRADLPALLAAR